MNSKDDDTDVMLQLLDVATRAFRKGDTDITLAALEKVEQIANQLPKKVICLPDRSGERL